MSTWTGAVSTDWNNAANWTTGGTGTGVPSATVDAIFSGTPTRPCVLGANRTCRALTFTGYTSTVDLATFTLTVNNNVTFQANQSSIILGTTGVLAHAANGTITSNGGTWPLNHQMNNFAGATYTLADDFRVSGNHTTFGGTTTINGNQFFIGGSLTGGALVTGTTNIIMNGTGTVTGCNTNLEINTTGTITIAGNLNVYRRFIITSVGTLIGLSTSNITFLSNSITTTHIMDLGGRQIGNLTLTNGGGTTWQFLSSLTCNNFSVSNGTMNYSGPTSPLTAIITVNGNYFFNGFQLLGNGTLSIIMTGASGAAAITTFSATINIPLTINAGANTVFFPAAANINIGPTTLTLSSGNINANVGQVTLSGTTLNTPNVNYYDMVVSSGTVTINSLFNVTRNLTLAAGGNVIFSGSAGWTCANLICTTAGRTLTLANSSSGAFYRTTNNAALTGGTAASRITMTSDNATTQSIWTLDNGAIQSLIYVNGTRIDSSQGQTIWSFGGTLVSASNWGTGSQPLTVANTFVC